MGRHMGQLAKISGITFFRLSPFELKPFAGFLDYGLSNTLRRFNDLFVYIAPTFATAYVLQEWALYENHLLHRKNPKDFENDV